MARRRVWGDGARGGGAPQGRDTQEHGPACLPWTRSLPAGFPRAELTSNLAEVTQTYGEEFVRTYDRLFALFQEGFEQYGYHSVLMRAVCSKRKKRFPLLHRNGGYYLVSPMSERLERIDADQLPQSGVYRK